MSKSAAFDALMHEVCVEKGWCGSIVDDEPKHVTDFLPESGEVTADQFVMWLFAADGVNPVNDAREWQTHFDGLRDAFVRHMGSSRVQAERLKWNDD